MSSSGYSQREAGVSLYPSIMETLEPWAAKLGVALPARSTKSGASAA